MHRVKDVESVSISVEDNRNLSNLRGDDQLQPHLGARLEFPSWKQSLTTVSDPLASGMSPGTRIAENVEINSKRSIRNEAFQ